MKNHLMQDVKNNITKQMSVGRVIINAEKENPNAAGN